jgi:hypothetical protein
VVERKRRILKIGRSKGEREREKERGKTARFSEADNLRTSVIRITLSAI